MLLMAYPRQGSRSMHEGHALLQLKNCWRVVLLGLDPRDLPIYVVDTGKERFPLLELAKKADSEHPVLQRNVTSWLLTFKSLFFTQSCALQTAVWFRCNSSWCSCRRGSVAAMRLNQYLQQLHGTLPSSFLSLFNLAEIILHHFLAIFSSKREQTAQTCGQMVLSQIPLQMWLRICMEPHWVKEFWAAATQALFVSCTLNSNNAAPMQLIYCP